MKPKKITRRAFATRLAAPLILPSGLWGANAPSKKLTLGAIGLGAQGRGNLRAFLGQPDVRVLAVCDVHDLHYRDKPHGTGTAYGLNAARDQVNATYKNNDCKSYTDFREICARDDLDLILVATPDHWHALAALEALRNGKDVYGEKPVTHLFAEGQALYREAKKQKAIFQVGSQQRSSENFRWAAELVLNGHLGKLERVEIGLPRGYSNPEGDATIKQPPKGLDYDMYCGPSELLPYMDCRVHRHWRGHRNFGGGRLMDWIGHHNDIAHWGMGMDKGGPTEVEAVGWTFPNNDVYNTATDYEIRCTYPGGIETSMGTPNDSGTKFIGSDGWVQVNRGVMNTSNREWRISTFDRGPIKAYVSKSHHRNFLDCVKSRKPTICPAETGHRSITPGHLGIVAQAVGRTLKWDPEQEQIVNDQEAMKRLMHLGYRGDWRLEG
jgi:predicted dehydrogenase